MRILSVNIGARRDVEIRGKPITTGIYKSRVPGEHFVDREGIVGDVRVVPRSFGEAHHAVYAYPHEHYEYWERRLEREPFPLGQFGENLTIAGLLETEARIGDVLRVGSTLLQIAQPRIPCRRLDHRMGVKFARTFLESRRVGYYLRVLETGHVSEGATIELVERDPSSPTMDEFVRISQHDYWDADGLEYLRGARDLPPGWIEVLDDKLKRARAAKGWIGLRPLQVAEIRRAADAALSVRLVCAYGRELPAPRPGQHLALTKGLAKNDRVARRAYALSGSTSDAEGYWITATPHDPGSSTPAVVGSVSSALDRPLQVGDQVLAPAPRGSVTLDLVPDQSSEVALISEGIALAKTMGILRHLAREQSRAPIAIMHEDESGKTQAFSVELLSIAPPGRLRIAYRTPGPKDVIGRDFHVSGHLSRAAIEPLLFGGGGHALVAGSSGFLGRIGELLFDLGIPADRMHVERFV